MSKLDDLEADDRLTPHELIRRYYPLEGCVAPLAEIIRTQPAVAEAVIELAMVLGIHAQERYRVLLSHRFLSEIINATALDPGKVYVLEADRTKVNAEQLQAVLRWLTDRAGIRCVAIATHDGDGLRVVDAPASYVTGAGKTSAEAVAAASERQEDL